ncbi:MAG: rRNA cytosine-C5-methyltransferase [Bacteroidales bacterium]|nr:rRNA cytosine-C5-methyltransferase [Bacteroidales bacterium]
MTLPEAFIDDIDRVLDPSELTSFLSALTDGEQPVSIRLNPRKPGGCPTEAEPIGWCPEGRYLKSRPQFTLDPLLHAGAYYVQEASSQFLSHVLRSFVKDSVTALDLCAAPGGKSTAAISSLPEGSMLVSNEIDRKRARILSENIQKWGYPNVCVTANAPADFKGFHHTFDLIITDVPCSGEGMFRKDAGAIAEWNPAKVHECVALQRQILRDVWDCLKPGGLLVYSTCTFNVHENEEQLQFIIDELGADLLPISVEKTWNIHPALTGAFAPSVHTTDACRFMPHYTQGEGLFMAVLRKHTDNTVPDERPYKKSLKKETGKQHNDRKSDSSDETLTRWLNLPVHLHENKDGSIRAIPKLLENLYNLLTENRLFILSAGIELGVRKGRDVQPAQALALSSALASDAFPTAELDIETALNYLRRESIVLPPSVPRGYVLLTYQQTPLGFVKNIGNRCNSLYPMEWRIRNL